MRIKLFIVLLGTVGLTVKGTGKNLSRSVTMILVSFSVQNEPGLKASDFSGRLNELFTLEMASEISGFDASKAVTEYGNKARAVFGGSDKPPRECNYLWSNGRTRAVTIGGNKINAPYKDKLSIHSVSNTTLERFNRNYGVLTEEQKQAAAKKFEETTAKSGSSASVHNMTNTGIEMVQNFHTETISGVGEAAAWYEDSNEMKVFYKGLVFSVVVDISDDKKVNRSKSIELARLIIRDKLR